MYVRNYFSWLAPISMCARLKRLQARKPPRGMGKGDHATRRACHAHAVAIEAVKMMTKSRYAAGPITEFHTFSSEHTPRSDRKPRQDSDPGATTGAPRS